jgi:hypothetical protein
MSNLRRCIGAYIFGLLHVVLGVPAVAQIDSGSLSAGLTILAAAESRNKTIHGGTRFRHLVMALCR